MKPAPTFFRRAAQHALALESRMLFDAATVATASSIAAAESRQAESTQHQQDDQAGTLQRAGATLAQTPSITGKSIELAFNGRLDVYASDLFMDVATGARDTVFSSDGNHLYAVSVNENGDSTLSVLARDANGDLTHLQSLADRTYDDNDMNALADASRVVISSDQSTVYVIGRTNNTVLAFSRDAQTGMLTANGGLTDAALKSATGAGADEGSFITDMVSRDGRLYVAAGNSLLLLRQDAGALSVVATYTDGVNGVTGLQGVNRLLLSADGNHLYAAGEGSASLLSVFAVGADGALSNASSVTGTAAENYARALTLSPDGSTLYVINNTDSPTIEALRVNADGSLSTLASYALNDPGNEMVVAADGGALFLVGNAGISSYDRAGDGSLTLHKTLTDGGEFREFSQLTSISLSADGGQLFVTGISGNQDQLMRFDVSAPGLPYTEGDPARVILPSAELSSPTRDAAASGGDYNGVVVTFERSQGAVATDHYDLLSENGWTMNGGSIMHNGNAVATFSQQAGIATLTFTATISRADVQQLVRQITYSSNSKDPTRDGEQAQLRLTMDDGSGSTASTEVQLSLVGINDPAIVTSTALDPTLTEGDSFVQLFSNTHIDTVETGQRVWNVRLVIDSAGGPNEQIRYSGGTFALVPTSGAQTLPSGMQYHVAVSGGRTTVTLYITLIENPRGDEQAVAAAAVIDSIQYNNFNTGLSGTRTVELSVEELNRDISDTGETRTTLADTVTITLAGATEANTAPVLQGPASQPAYTERGPAILPAAGVTVSDLHMDRANNGNGNYAGATLVVALGAGSSSRDSLSFQPGNNLALAGNELQKDGVTIGRVSNSAGTLQIVFSDNGGAIPTRADVQNALQQISYQSTEQNPAASVALTVTLADRQLTSTPLALSIAVTAVNEAPQIARDPVAGADTLAIPAQLGAIAGLATVRAATASADGATVYVADQNGAIAELRRDPATGALSHRTTMAPGDGLGAIRELLLSADGTSLYAISTTDERNSVAHFSRAADGALSFVATLASDYANDRNIDNIRAMVASADGEAVYMINTSYIVHFNRNPATGALSYHSTIDDTGAPLYQWSPGSLTMAGNILFVTNNDPGDNDTVVAYQRGSGGDLAALGQIAGASVGMRDVTHSAVSADGGRLYLVSGNAIHQLTFDAGSNRFSYIGNIASGLASVSDLAISGDGRVLYASSVEGKLARYAIDGARLLPINIVDSSGAGSVAGLAGASQVVTTADGGVLVVGAGLAALDERASPATTYHIGGEPVILAPALSIGDVELDAAGGGSGDYNGASFVIGRSPAGNSSDSFGFSAGNGLTLNTDNQIVLNGTAIASFVRQDGVLTVTFTAPTSSAEARAVLRQITYASSATTPGDVALQLTVSDGDASTSYAIGVSLAATIAPPTIKGDMVDLSYGRTDDGWFSDANMNVLAGARDSVASADGKFVYVVSVDASGNASLNVLTRATNGNLATIQSLFSKTSANANNIDALTGISRITMSHDQDTIYVIANNNGAVLSYQRDASTGRLSAAATFGADLGGPITDVVSRDGYLFVSAGNSVTVLREGAATLDLVQTYAVEPTISDRIDTSRLLLSSDGKHLYVAGNGGNAVVTIYAVGADGVLTRTGNFSRAGSDNYVRALEASADGKSLYVINNVTDAPVLEVFDIGAEGSLSSKASYALAGAGNEVTISADGRTVFVVGNGRAAQSGASAGPAEIAAYTRAADGTLVRQDTLTGNGTSLTSRFGDLRSVTLAPDGRHLYVAGIVGQRDALTTINMSLLDVAYTEGQAAVAILSTGQLSSPTKDAAGSYAGATLTLVRSAGAISTDVFGLLPGSGLELSNHEIRRGDTVLATLVQENGAATVTFGAGASQGDAQQILRQLSYSSTSNDPLRTGQPRLQLTFNDGSGAQSSTDIELVITSINSNAIVNTTVLQPTLAAGGEPVKLFSNTSIDTVEAGQNIWKVQLRMDGVGANETITYSGGSFALTPFSGVGRLPGGAQYQVMANGSTTTVVLFVMQPAATAAALIDSIAYNNSNSTLSGTRSVRLEVFENVSPAQTVGTVVADQARITLGSGSITPPVTPPVDPVPPTTPPVTPPVDPLPPTTPPVTPPVDPLPPTTPPVTPPVDPLPPTTPPVTPPVDPLPPTTPPVTPPVDPLPPTTPPVTPPVDPLPPTTPPVTPPVDPAPPTTPPVTPPVDPLPPTTPPVTPPVDPLTPTTPPVTPPVDPLPPTTPPVTPPVDPVPPTTPPVTPPVDPAPPTTPPVTPPVDSGTPTTPSVTPPVDSGTPTTPPVAEAPGAAPPLLDNSMQQAAQREAADREASEREQQQGALTRATAALPATAQAAGKGATSGSANDHSAGETSASNTLNLLATLQARQNAEQAQQAVRMADGRSTTLVIPGEAQGPALSRTVASLSGAWQADPAGNRQIFSLPQGLFSSRAPVESLTLRMRDGQPLPPGVRLDVERGIVIAGGAQAPARTLALEIVVRDTEGGTLAIPLTLSGGTPASDNDSTPAAQDSGKPALSMQLRQHATSDLYAQAQALLHVLSQPDSGSAQAMFPHSNDAVADAAGATTIES